MRNYRSVLTFPRKKKAEATPRVKSPWGSNFRMLPNRRMAHSLSPESRLSLLAVVSQVPVVIRSILDIHRCPRVRRLSLPGLQPLFFHGPA